jgi:hypothetical protein
MDNFDLKKYLAEGRLNEGVNSGQGSAVEWLAEQFDNIVELYPSQFEKINNAIEQAKAKEIENIKNAFNYGQTDPGMEADEYLDFINLK